jgi:steroid 5-alpha reductase family enzyme
MRERGARFVRLGLCPATGGPTTSLARMAKSLLTIAATIGVAALVALAGAQGGAEFFGLPVIVVCAGFAFAVQWLAFIPSYLKQTEHYYDLVGSVTYLSTIWLAVASADHRQPRSLLIAAAVSVWALRLGSFLFKRVKRAGKDGRFDDIKTSFPRFLVAWTLQALWVFLTLSAALAAITVEGANGLGPLDAIGGAVWLVGFGIEVVADRQKSAFRLEHPGRFINRGLWAWSRHPNYFGEIVLWLGIALVAASTVRGWQFVTMISPLFVAFLLTKVSGIPMLEARADARWGEDEDYRAYKSRTPPLLLRPPGP